MSCLYPPQPGHHDGMITRDRREAGGGRPGHSESEVLRSYVSIKTVEEIVIARKAQAAVARSRAPPPQPLVPRPPPLRSKRRREGRSGGRHARTTSRGGILTSSAATSARQHSARGARSIYSRLNAQPTLASAGGTAARVEAVRARADVARERAEPLRVNQERQRAQLERVHRLAYALDELMGTPADAFGDMGALAALAPPPLASLLRLGGGGSRSIQQDRVEERSAARTPTAAATGGKAAGGHTGVEERSTDVFARALLAGWVESAVGVLAVAAYERLYSVPTASSTARVQAGGGSGVGVGEPEQEKPVAPVPLPPLRPGECQIGTAVRLLRSAAATRAACRDYAGGGEAHSWTPQKEAACGLVGCVEANAVPPDS